MHGRVPVLSSSSRYIFECAHDRQFSTFSLSCRCQRDWHDHSKYIPDVSRSLIGILEGMRKRKAEEQEGIERPASPRKQDSIVGGVSPAKRFRSSESAKKALVDRLTRGSLTEDTIKQKLTEAVEANLDERTGDYIGEEGARAKQKKDDIEGQPLYLVPIYDKPIDFLPVIQHPLFDFYPMNIRNAL